MGLAVQFRLPDGGRAGDADAWAPAAKQKPSSVAGGYIGYFIQKTADERCVAQYLGQGFKRVRLSLFSNRVFPDQAPKWRLAAAGVMVLSGVGVTRPMMGQGWGGTMFATA